MFIRGRGEKGHLEGKADLLRGILRFKCRWEENDGSFDGGLVDQRQGIGKCGWDRAGVDKE
jgi:hypothetical protein